MEPASGGYPSIADYSITEYTPMQAFSWMYAHGGVVMGPKTPATKKDSIGYGTPTADRPEAWRAHVRRFPLGGSMV